tara:strand:- start:2392 stop:2817 length:426 start_codon:yes stop_codon:yes gene_type:complete
MNVTALTKACRELSIGEFICYGEITDDASLKENLKVCVGIHTGTDMGILVDAPISYADFKSKYDAHLAAEPMQKLREIRNHKLSKSDWSQSSDVPDSLKTKYQTYRQELRDLPAQSGINPKIDDVDGMLIDSSINWPNEPS